MPATPIASRQICYTYTLNVDSHATFLVSHMGLRSFTVVVFHRCGSIPSCHDRSSSSLELQEMHTAYMVLELLHHQVL